jgi:hypothetical protein
MVALWFGVSWCQRVVFSYEILPLPSHSKPTELQVTVLHGTKCPSQVVIVGLQNMFCNHYSLVIYDQVVVSIFRCGSIPSAMQPIPPR